MDRPGTEQFFISTVRWPRLSKYEVIRHGKEVFIRPISQAHIQERYYPFDHQHRERLLEDFLNMAASLQLAKGMPDTREEITAFAERDALKIVEFYDRWGCLGLLWKYAGRFYLTTRITEATCKGKAQKIKQGPGVLLLDRYQHLGAGMVDYYKYVRLFLTDKETTPPVDVVGSFQEDFLRRYSEPVLDIVAACRGILHPAEEWERFKQGKFDPQEPVIFKDEAAPVKKRFTWAEYLSAETEVWPISLGLLFEEDLRKIQYGFDSLYSVLKVLRLEVAASEEQSIGKCEREGCPKWWVAPRANKKYCSARCRETAKKRRQRRASKERSK